MTENKRFEFIGLAKDTIKDNVTGESHWVVEYTQRERILDLLNEQEETINNLKKALWESQMSYIEEKNEYSIDVERDIDWLKKEFEREYWNSDAE